MLNKYFLLFFLILTPLFGVQHGGVDFYQFDEALLKQAREENRVVTIFFTADWCGACKYFKSTALRDKRVIQKLRFAKNFVVDFSKTSQPVGVDYYFKYRANGLPTLLIIKPNGNYILTRDADEIVDFL